MPQLKRGPENLQNVFPSHILCYLINNSSKQFITDSVWHKLSQRSREEGRTSSITKEAMGPSQPSSAQCCAHFGECANLSIKPLLCDCSPNLISCQVPHIYHFSCLQRLTSPSSWKQFQAKLLHDTFLCHISVELHTMSSHICLYTHPSVS